MTRLLFVSLLAAGCGGPSSKVPTVSAADSGAEAAALPTHLVSTLPSDVRNPPPFDLASKHAHTVDHADWRACHVGFQPQADPSKAVEALAQGCATATKMHGGVAALMTGTQSAASSAAVAYKFHAAKDHCYRLYGAAAAGVKTLVAVVNDGEGRQIAAYHTDDVVTGLAPDEAMCFSDESDVTVTVSVGLGDGAYALSVWGT